jgi:acetyl esterase
MQWSLDRYAPDLAARREPTATPLRAPLGYPRELSPSLVITAEADVLRDEGEAYAHKLLAAGVAVTAVRYLGRSTTSCCSPPSPRPGPPAPPWHRSPPR